jgi:hypothetical protein
MMMQRGVVHVIWYRFKFEMKMHNNLMLQNRPNTVFRHTFEKLERVYCMMSFEDQVQMPTDSSPLIIKTVMKYSAISQ